MRRHPDRAGHAADLTISLERYFPDFALDDKGQPLTRSAESPEPGGPPARRAGDQGYPRRSCWVRCRVCIGWRSSTARSPWPGSNPRCTSTWPWSASPRLRSPSPAFSSRPPARCSRGGGGPANRRPHDRSRDSWSARFLGRSFLPNPGAFADGGGARGRRTRRRGPSSVARIVGLLAGPRRRGDRGRVRLAACVSPGVGVRLRPRLEVPG